MIKKFINLFKKKEKIKSEELWNLDVTIAKFILPRIHEFRINTDSYPGNITWEEWQLILYKIEKGFDCYLNEDKFTDKELSIAENAKNQKKIIDEGLELFVEYFGCLWW